MTPLARRLSLGTAAAAVAVSAFATTPASRVAGSEVSVIVREAPNANIDPLGLVGSVGGRLLDRLDIINGFSARIPSGTMAELAATPGIAAVTPDAAGHLLSTYDPTTDSGSLLNAESRVGARNAWTAGFTGQGVDVALIDSGVAPVNGLTAPGKIINGPDFSLESPANNLQYLDTYGHGTHMAGIIAGRDDGATTSASNSTDFLGMAPDARIVSIKVADSHGNTDVSQILAAIDWVVRHRNDHGMNIRVLNLSYGTHASDPYTTDPLAYAAEAAWRSGIFVVAAAGNDGSGTSLTDPAYDPNILAVGAAASPTSLLQSLTQDAVAAFSSSPLDGRHVDLVAPGAHIQSLRDPGSYIDQMYSSTGAITNRFFRGSGTSQAAAMVSGAAALLIQEHPSITPDQLKLLLRSTATPILGTSSSEGSGELNVAAALNHWVSNGFGDRQQLSTGSGSLDGARGGVMLTMKGVGLTGNTDIFGNAMSGQEVATSLSGGSTLMDSEWLAGDWTGTSWAGPSWQAVWSDTTLWSGATWNSASWSSHSWSAAGWNSASWSSASWSSASWSSGSWSSGSWSSGSWSSGSWSSSSWSSSSWSSTLWQ